MKISVWIIISCCSILMASVANSAPTPSPLGPYTVLPPIGKGHRKIGKLSLLKNKGNLSSINKSNETQKLIVIIINSALRPVQQSAL